MTDNEKTLGELLIEGKQKKHVFRAPITPTTFSLIFVAVGLINVLAEGHLAITLFCLGIYQAWAIAAYLKGDK